MSIRLRSLLMLLLGSFALNAFAGYSHETDSLLKVMGGKGSTAGTYNRLAELYRKYNADSSLLFAHQALNMSVNSGNKKEMAAAYNHIGNAYYFKGDYPVAIEYHQKSFLIRQQLGDTSGMANSLNNIGVNYRRLDDYDKALDYYLRSLELKEQLKNKSDVISSLNNIGGVYYYQRNFGKAGEYYERALKVAISIHDSTVIGAAYNNLSLIYDEKKEYSTALKMANLALAIREKLNDPGFIAVSLNNIGRIYEHLKDVSKAFFYYKKAADLYKKTGNTPDLANTLYNIGNIYLTLGDNAHALSYFTQSLEISKDIDNRLQLRDIYHGLAFTQHGMGHDDKAFGYMSRYIDLNDSIYDEESMKRISEMEVKYQSEKKIRENELLKQESELKDLEQQAEQKKQKLVTIAFVSGIVVMLFIAGLLYNRSQIRKKANQRLETINRDLVRQKEETDQQKKLVDEKNKEITDSIYYAQKIQQALIPPEEEFERLLPGSFVFFRPKDIVSGDFYWMTQKEEHLFFAAVDCTGHGVPGGFMSMLGNSLLNEVVNEKKAYEPADILDVLRLQIIFALRQKGVSGENKDGMDMALCRLNRDRTELVYAGANNPLYLVRGGVLTEYRPDKQPIGISGGETRQFSQQVISLQKNDCIYIFTDGYADQFGGPKGKKFKYRQLEDLLKDHASLSPGEQKAALEKAFDNWKEGYGQVDDVCVIGLKI